jgi:hypothetical protein
LFVSQISRTFLVSSSSSALSNMKLSMFYQTNHNWQTIHWKPVMSQWLVSYARGTQQKSVSCPSTIHLS